jgi:hypothetical protein
MRARAPSSGYNECVRRMGALVGIGVALVGRAASAQEQPQSSRGEQTETEAARSRG